MISVITVPDLSVSAFKAENSKLIEYIQVASYVSKRNKDTKHEILYNIFLLC